MKNVYVKPQIIKMEVAMEGTILTGSLPVGDAVINDPIQIQSKRMGNGIIDDSPKNQNIVF